MANINLLLRNLIIEHLYKRIIFFNYMKNKKLILFDLDGVLIDFKKNMQIAWESVCHQHNIYTEFEKYFMNIGRPFQDILNVFILSRPGVLEKSESFEMYRILEYRYQVKALEAIDFSISVDTPEDLERIRSDKGVILLM